MSRLTFSARQLLIGTKVTLPSLPTGAARCAAAPLLPAVVEALGALPGPRSAVRPDRRVPVHFCRDGKQLLLHALAVAHPGGHLRGLPAAPQGEEAGGAGLEPWLELDLEATGVRLHAVREQHRRAVHRLVRRAATSW